MTETASPEFECDLVLKGGVTSGVVYPPAIFELAKSHRFRQIGGTSAGAIGAAGAAAAEFGRQNGVAGFEILDQVADELQEVDATGHTKLFRLFRPQPQTQSYFDLIWMIRTTKGVSRLTNLLRSSLRAAGLRRWVIFGTVVFVLSGVAIGGGLAVGSPASLTLSVPMSLLLVTVALVVLTGLGLWSLVTNLQSTLDGNLHGLVSGQTPDGDDDLAVTDWLYALLQRLAGRDEKSPPLTHGDLATAGVTLVSLTTNLSQGTSEQVPFRKQTWAFSKSEMRRLFPKEIVEHLEKYAVQDADPEVLDALHGDLCLLPPPEQLPILVAVRISLSFPILLSTVPLYALSFRRDEDGEWKALFKRNLFSDGGITSNMPVHLFDAAIPTRPTFGINLTGGGNRARPADKNVFRPLDMNQGRHPHTVELASTLGVLGAVFDTMMNWSDNDLTRVAGFRERICAIRLDKGEGGMNLDMPVKVIAPLIERGRAAGRNLASMNTGQTTNNGIDPTDDYAPHQWDRHRWTRFRMLSAGLAELIDAGNERFEMPAPTTIWELSDQAGTQDSPLPYDDDWSAKRRVDVREAWDAALALGGHSTGVFGPTPPANTALAFGASATPVEIIPTNEAE